MEGILNFNLIVYFIFYLAKYDFSADIAHYWMVTSAIQKNFFPLFLFEEKHHKNSHLYNI